MLPMNVLLRHIDPLLTVFSGTLVLFTVAFVFVLFSPREKPHLRLPKEHHPPEPPEAPIPVQDKVLPALQTPEEEDEILHIHDDGAPITQEKPPKEQRPGDDLFYLDDN